MNEFLKDMKVGIGLIGFLTFLIGIPFGIIYFAEESPIISLLLFIVGVWFTGHIIRIPRL